MTSEFKSIKENVIAKKMEVKKKKVTHFCLPLVKDHPQSSRRKLHPTHAFCGQFMKGNLIAHKPFGVTCKGCLAKMTEVAEAETFAEAKEILGENADDIVWDNIEDFYNAMISSKLIDEEEGNILRKTKTIVANRISQLEKEEEQEKELKQRQAEKNTLTK